MTKIALLGAGGKMGMRLSANLKGTRFEVDHVEVSDEGRARLKRNSASNAWSRARLSHPPMLSSWQCQMAHRQNPQDFRR